MAKKIGEQGAQDAAPQASRQPAADPSDHDDQPNPAPDPRGSVKEIGGPAGPDPTRYGDWERRGRCIDF